MQPIHELLNRIRWDPALAGHRFTLAYDDHVTHRDVVVPFDGLRFDRETPGAFTIVDEEGIARHVPLHRVRAVYRDGDVIWRRPRPEP